MLAASGASMMGVAYAQHQTANQNEKILAIEKHVDNSDVLRGKVEDRVAAIELELAEWKGYVIGFGGLFSLLQALGLLKSFRGKDQSA